MKKEISDLAEKFLLAGLGGAVMARERAGKLVSELAEKGEIKKGDAAKLVDDLLKKGEKARDDLRKIVKKEVNAALKNINIATKDDIDELKKKIRTIEKKI